MIDHHFQNRGYGHALFKTVLNYLLQHQKVEQIYLRVHPDNEKAVPFYESFRFKQTNEQHPTSGHQIMRYSI